MKVAAARGPKSSREVWRLKHRTNPHWPLFYLVPWQRRTSVNLALSGLCGGLTDGGIVSCRYAPAAVSFLPQNLFAAPPFGFFTSRVIAWNGWKWNWHKPACLSVIVCGCEPARMTSRACFWMLWVVGCSRRACQGCVRSHARACVRVCSHLLPAYYGCLFGVKSPCLWGC